MELDHFTIDRLVTILNISRQAVDVQLLFCRAGWVDCDWWASCLRPSYRTVQSTGKV